MISLRKKLYFRDNGIASILNHPGEGALFENSIFNQLREYGVLAYLTKGNEYEIDFILATDKQSSIGLEVKYHPIELDQQKLVKLVKKQGLSNGWIVGRYPTPEFTDFIWGGSIF